MAAPRFIFITGGVVSSLGKGIASASLGVLLKARGLKVRPLKLDPYINIDPGTMNPYQHGEVFVTDDGAETDLDLGHYERYIGEPMSRFSNFTSGRVYQNIIDKERRGEYLGQTVQVVPHITDEIKRMINEKHDEADISLVEIGGTIGDMESQPFLEAARQLSLELGSSNCLFIHLTLIIPIQDELKTKPTQHSVRELRSIGIQPSILLCRSCRMLAEWEREKIALYTQVSKEAVISCVDTDCIYEIPLNLRAQHLDDLVLRHFGLDKTTPAPSGLDKWQHIVDVWRAPKQEVRIAVVGKYTQLEDCYKSLYESLRHAGLAAETDIRIDSVDTDDLNGRDGPCGRLGEASALLIPGGFGKRGIEGKIAAARFAREQGLPYFGICLGMQIAVIEVARSLAGLEGANSTEFDPDSEHPVVAMVHQWRNPDGTIEQRLSDGQIGGTMRLGAQDCVLEPGSLVHRVYGSEQIRERHRHRYEINNYYRERLAQCGLVVTGNSAATYLSEEEDEEPELRGIEPDDHFGRRLVEVVEFKGHPWYIGCQYHPEYLSRPVKPHPLFTAFVAAALKRQGK